MVWYKSGWDNNNHQLKIPTDSRTVRVHVGMVCILSRTSMLILSGSPKFLLVKIGGLLIASTTSTTSRLDSLERLICLLHPHLRITKVRTDRRIKEYGWKSRHQRITLRCDLYPDEVDFISALLLRHTIMRYLSTAQWHAWGRMFT